MLKSKRRGIMLQSCHTELRADYGKLPSWTLTDAEHTIGCNQHPTVGGIFIIDKGNLTFQSIDKRIDGWKSIIWRSGKV